LHAILFCRNRWLDITFRVLAIAGLLLLALSGTGRFLMYIAILMAIGLPVAFKVGKVTDALRRTPLPPPIEGEDRIPLSTAETIVSALKAALPGKTNNKTLALHAVNVFETLNARPPGVLGTLGFLAVHGGSVILALLCGFLLILNKHGGGLGNFARAALRQPQHSVACDSIERWSGAEAAAVAFRNVVVATLRDHAAAKRQFGELIGRLPASASLTLFGDSLLLTLSAADDAARERWFAELQTAATNTFVALTNQSITVSLMCVAPNDAAATNLVEELNEYFGVTGFGDLVAPWSSQAAGTKYEIARQARRTWNAIGTNIAAVSDSSPIKAFNRQMIAARKRGAQSEAERLLKEQAEARNREKAAIYDRLRSQGVDSQLIDLHARLSVLEYTNRTERAAMEREISAKLGPASSDPGLSGKFVGHHGTVSGFANNEGLLVEADWMGFRDAPTGLPALLDWLCRKHCGTIKYDIVSTGLAVDDLLE